MTYDYQTAMKTNRQQWSDIGVVTVSSMVPQDHRAFFTAQMKITTAKFLLDKIDNGTTDLHEVFANRIPRLSFKPGDVYRMLANADADSLDTKLHKLLKQVVEGLEAKETERMSYEQGLAERDEVKTLFHGAREYAITYGVDGQWTVASMMLDGYEPPVIFG